MSRRPSERRDREASTRGAPWYVGSAQAAYQDAHGAWRTIAAPARFGSPDALTALTAVRTMLVSGRQVVFVLRKLKRIPPFVGWLGPIEDEMNSDPLLSRFAELRDETEKEGFPPLGATLDLHRGDEAVGCAYVDLGPDLFGVFAGGAVIGHADPEIARLAHTADNAWIRHVHIKKPPTQHLGRALDTDRIDVLGGLYLNYLRERLINGARAKLDAAPL